jgi:dipeptidyl aminopeptidase/acylaminoacyl peptidase
MRAATIVSALVATVLAAAVAGCGSSSPPVTTGPAGLAEQWGKPAGGRPHALVMLIPGGGWTATGAAQIANQLTQIGANLQGLGYETLAFGYRSGTQSVKDAELFFRLARKRVGPKLPICALGLSAGAHIALMLAAMNPDLACVIDMAGPTNLPALAGEHAGAAAAGLAVKAFGARRLAAYSPALRARSIRAKVLLIYAQSDQVVPVAQGEDMKRALPSARLIVLPPGPQPFVHSGVSIAADKGAGVILENFLKQVASS